MYTYYPVKQFITLMMLLKFFFEQPYKFSLVMGHYWYEHMLSLHAPSEILWFHRCFKKFFFFLQHCLFSYVHMYNSVNSTRNKFYAAHQMRVRCWVWHTICSDGSFDWQVLSCQLKSSWICKALEFWCLFLLPLSPEHSKGLKLCLSSQLY